MIQNKTRAFICIDFPSKIIKEIERVQTILKNKKFTGKLTELENLHLTLKFLGETTPENLEKVKSKLSKVQFQKFEAKLGNTGIFSYDGAPRIVWIKLLGKINILQKEIDSVLEELFPKESRFMSHTTIARIKYVKDVQAFKEYVKNIPTKKLKFEVNEFKLMKSELNNFSPNYEMIEEYKLK